jgi:PKHD-type hydroxylase
MLIQVERVLGPQDLDTIRSGLASAAFVDGAATAGPRAKTVKRNLQLPPDSKVALELGAIVSQALQRNALFNSAALPRRISTPMFNRYESGMEYGQHLDEAFMGQVNPLRTDIACTLFLTDPAAYGGGELVIQDLYGIHSVKLPAGNMIVYPANSMHRVNRVTHGARTSVILWVQSLVRDADRRRLLLDFDLAFRRLMVASPDHPEIGNFNACYNNLLRMWAEI